MNQDVCGCGVEGNQILRLQPTSGHPFLVSELSSGPPPGSQGALNRYLHSGLPAPVLVLCYSPLRDPAQYCLFPGKEWCRWSLRMRGDMAVLVLFLGASPPIKESSFSAECHDVHDVCREVAQLGMVRS